jgi:hypothetical protein
VALFCPARGSDRTRGSKNRLPARRRPYTCKLLIFRGKKRVPQMRPLCGR